MLLMNIEIYCNLMELFRAWAEKETAEIMLWLRVFYNRQRIHSSNNNLSPVAFEEKMLRNNQVA